MAVLNNSSVKDRWEEFCRQVVADYWYLTAVSEHAAPFFPLCEVAASLEGDAKGRVVLGLGSERYVFPPEELEYAKVLREHVAKGGRVFLGFMYDVKTGPTLYLKNGHAKVHDNLAYVSPGDDFQLSVDPDANGSVKLAPMLLPDKLDSEILRIAIGRVTEIIPFLDDQFKRLIDSMYKNLGYSREEELVMKFTDHLISDDGTLAPDQLYNVLSFLSREELDVLKDRIFDSVCDFYRTLQSHGEIESREEYLSLVDECRDQLDAYFDEENLLFAKLSYEVSNLGQAKNEVQSDDIAWVAVRAEKNPDYADYLGTRLEKWVVDESKAYGLKSDVVNVKRARLGGTVLNEVFNDRHQSKFFRQFKF